MVTEGVKLLNIGFHNSVAAGRIVSMVAADAAPVKRLREEAKRRGLLVDATNGRKTRSVIVTDTNHVVLSSVEPDTLASRLREKG